MYKLQHGQQNINVDEGKAAAGSLVRHSNKNVSPGGGCFYKSRWAVYQQTLNLYFNYFPTRVVARHFPGIQFNMT